MTKSEKDQFILAHYGTAMSARMIGEHINMPRGSVITRYSVLVGRRKGDVYTRRDGAVTNYGRDEDKIIEPPSEIVPAKITLPRVTLDR